MINLLDRQHCIDLIHEATASGATLNKACRVLEVHPKTYRRWFIKGTVLEDGRPKAKGSVANRRNSSTHDIIAPI